MARPITPMEPRNCAHCGKTMERKRYNGKLEDRSRYKERKYCNYTCMGKAKQIGDKVTIQYSRRQSAKTVREKCEICEASNKTLQVHHKNGNPLDNATENLQTLCVSCHQKVHSQRYTEEGDLKTCSICEEPVAKGGKGWCNKHYLRWKVHGDPLLKKKQVKGKGWVLIREL